MKVENIYKKDDGTRYKVEVEFITNFNVPEGKWDLIVLTCPPGKRKFECLVNQDDYRYRGLSFEERVEYAKAAYLKHVPIEWIRETQQMLVDKIAESITTLLPQA